MGSPPRAADSMLDASGCHVPVVPRAPTGTLRIFADIGLRLGLVAFGMMTLLALLFFPYSTDAPLTAAEQAELQKFYATAYQRPAAMTEEKDDSAYVQIATEEAVKHDVIGSVSSFASAHGLTDKKVLDIGAGRGYLQDVVSDYTALDISPSVKRFFHKPFVVGTATYMPFTEGQFDAAWTIWVLEHVPNPEAALVEMRRVVKDGGLVYLAPAWDCSPWAANGYPVRPYGDFGFGGKLIKASVPAYLYAWSVSKAPVRLIGYATSAVASGPIQLRYRRITPNYQHYWMPDSDAVNSLDRYATANWFLSRGDECLNCEGALHGWMQPNEPLVLRIHKAKGAK